MAYKLDRLEIHAVDFCNLSCIACNHSSPFLKRKTEYKASEYIPWIEKIRARGVEIGKLAITGGEPFLHKSLAAFITQVKEAAQPDLTEVFSNCFWLKDESSIAKYNDELISVDRLHYSLYEPIVAKIGLEEIHRLLDVIRARYDHLHVATFVEGVNKTFGLTTFYEEPVERLPHQTCAVKTCTQLRSNGLLYRCTQGLAMEGDPGMTEGFRGSKDIVFDLVRDVDRDFVAWATKWPLDACAFCSCGHGRETPIKWVSDPAIRGMTADEYEKRLVQIAFKGT